MKETHYRPLPDGLYIGLSTIDGNGLFTSIELTADSELGFSHVEDYSGLFNNNYIRTPLGGFVNHSTTPNCEFYKAGRYMKMKTLKNIPIGGELTVTYKLYDPS